MLSHGSAPMNVSVVVFYQAITTPLTDVENTVIGFAAMNVDIELTIHSLFY